MILASEFLIRRYLNKPFPHRENTYIGNLAKVDFKMKQMIFGVYFSSLCMFIRYFLFPSFGYNVVGRLNFLIA